MLVLTVVGTRPQFVKAATVSRHLRRVHREILLHTGQHYDDYMSDQFFRELHIPPPDHHLGVGSGSHAKQTAQMLIGIEATLVREKPDVVLVYGDTNSTLAGALAAAKLRVPVAHVEAGLRSFNRAMPEELNRIVTDRVADLLFCPSQIAADNLASEGMRSGVHVVGDVMAETLRFATENGHGGSDILARLGLTARQYLLATVHRAENADDHTRLRSLLAGFDTADECVVFPVHPRTRKAIEALDYSPQPNLMMLDPVGYLDMVRLEQSARLILTDSGGVQKEAYWLGAPCITLRDETEWVETVQTGWNLLVGSDTARIAQAIRSFVPPAARPPLYGNGRAAERIVQLLSVV